MAKKQPDTGAMLMNAVNTVSVVDKASAQPLYQQIKNVISQKISEGRWQAGQKIPSENELVDSLDVSRMTVNRALRELTREGLLNRVHGLGTFVSETPGHASLIQLKDIAEEIDERGQQHSSTVLMHLKIKASAEIAEKMQLLPNQDVFYLKTVHFQDSVPIQLEERYVNSQMIPEFMDINFETQTSTSYLMAQFRPDQMEHRVQAIMPDEKTRELLQLDQQQPCLKLSRRTWKNNHVVTYVTMMYPGNRYDLAAKYSTNDYQIVKNQ